MKYPIIATLVRNSDMNSASQMPLIPITKGMTMNAGTRNIRPRKSANTIDWHTFLTL